WGSGSFGDNCAVEVQTLHDRCVRESEKSYAPFGFERPFHPRRYDDHVALGDVVARAGEMQTALSLEDLEHHGADVAAGAGARTGTQAMELGADRRHDVAAGGGIGVPDGGVAGFGSRRVALVLERELFVERAVGVHPAIAGDG